MAFTSSSARVVGALAVLAASIAEGVVLHRAAPAVPADDHQVANLFNVKSLIGSVTQVRGLQAAAVLMEAVPAWATPMPHCAKAVNGTLTKLSRAYLPPNVATALHQSCEDFHVYSDIGGDKEGCRKLMAELAKEFNGERNYFTWCRSLTLSSFDVIKKMKEEFEANETLKGWRNQCAEHCPYVAKMMEASVNLNQFMQKFSMEAMENEDKEQGAKDMEEFLEIMLRQFNQMCDWRHQATCNSVNMHSSCHKLLEPSGMGVDQLEQIEKECDAREGCKKSCHGVDASLVDFTMDQLKMIQNLPLPDATVGAKFCQDIDLLSECAKKEECDTYLERKVSRGGDSATKYFESWAPSCKWFRDSCAANRETACPTQVAEFRKVWKEDVMCWVGDELSEECCKTLEDLAFCDKTTGCAAHLAAGVPLLPFPGLDVSIPEQCPKVVKLDKAFMYGASENTTSAGDNTTHAF